ncbi:MAG: hypothetical protein R3F65_30755 [bacterium]|nr:hypothetical protein [Myxococcales bacterium]
MTPAYLAEIERAFTEHTGRGLMLSPLDRDRVAAWARAGVPAEVVVEGITRAFEKPPRRRVRSLGYAVKAIERAIKLWREARVGRDPGPRVEPGELFERAFAALLDRVEAAGRAERDPARQELKRRAWREVDTIRHRWRAGDEPQPIGAVIDAERHILRDALAALPPAERAGIDDAVLTALDGFSIHDPETLAITRETLLHDALRAHLALPALELRFEGG